MTYECAQHGLAASDPVCPQCEWEADALTLARVTTIRVDRIRWARTRQRRAAASAQHLWTAHSA